MRAVANSLCRRLFHRGGLVRRRGPDRTHGVNRRPRTRFRQFSTSDVGSGEYKQVIEGKALERVRELVSEYQSGLDDLIHRSAEMDPETLKTVSVRVSRLESAATMAQDLESARVQLEDCDSLIQELSSGAAGSSSASQQDEESAEMLELAKEERSEALAAIERAERELLGFLVPPDSDESRGAVLEIRAGAGGDEAALFAAEIYEMYRKHAASKGWKFEDLGISKDNLGGYREASAIVEGDNVYQRLQFETGVHRVQRVPATETQGRLHTSTCTVATLPEAPDVKIVVDEKDIRVDTYRASGAGGQHVNKTDSAVRLTHIPTGLVVAIQDDRSQHSNKSKALKLLAARLHERERSKQQQERDAIRSSQIGTGDRSEKIRTYNFARNQINDHRIKHSEFGMDDMLNGDLLDSFIDELIFHQRLERLKRLDISASVK